MSLPVLNQLVEGPHNSQLRLLEYLGGGAFGDVFKAQEEHGAAIYAVKFPRLVADSHMEMTSFLNEIRAAAEIEHPNVVRVVHVQTGPNVFPYLVMEFIEGGTLRSRLDSLKRANSLPDIGTLGKWTNGLVDGIAAINAKMLHRDLKPDNILMDGDTPKIADFGLSKAVGALTRSRTFKGGQHVLYMAPEGWRLETNEIQLDMYAMGIIWFEMASLEYPYRLPTDPYNVDTLREMHLFGEPRSLQDLRPDLPIAFCHIVSRLMEKRPQERFPDWNAARDALRQVWGANDTIAAGPIPLVDTLLDATQRVHQKRLVRQLEEEKRRAQLREENQLDEFQRESLLQSLRAAIQEFNKRSSLGQISESPRVNKIDFLLPHSGSVVLSFFRVDPPLSLRRGHVRYAGHLTDSDGGGVNYLLCRTAPHDLYGEWLVCRARLSPTVKLPPRPEPFGFPSQEIHEIERSDLMSHVYYVHFGGDLQEAFLETARACMNRALSDH